MVQCSTFFYLKKKRKILSTHYLPFCHSFHVCILDTWIRKASITDDYLDISRIDVNKYSLYKQVVYLVLGYLSRCCHRHGRKPIFNIGNFLNSHKGFDRLSTEDDDHDIDNALDDSDNEEFSITRKAWFIPPAEGFQQQQ